MGKFCFNYAKNINSVTLEPENSNLDPEETQLAYVRLVRMSISTYIESYPLIFYYISQETFKCLNFSDTRAAMK